MKKFFSKKRAEPKTSKLWKCKHACHILATPFHCKSSYIGTRSKLLFRNSLDIPRSFSGFIVGLAHINFQRIHNEQEEKSNDHCCAKNCMVFSEKFSTNLWPGFSPRFLDHAFHSKICISKVHLENRLPRYEIPLNVAEKNQIGNYRWNAVLPETNLKWRKNRRNSYRRHTH